MSTLGQVRIRVSGKRYIDPLGAGAFPEKWIEPPLQRGDGVVESLERVMKIQVQSFKGLKSFFYF